MRGINKNTRHQYVCLQAFNHVDGLFPLLLKTFSDPSDEVGGSHGTWYHHLRIVYAERDVTNTQCTYEQYSVLQVEDSV